MNWGTVCWIAAFIIFACLAWPTNIQIGHLNMTYLGAALTVLGLLLQPVQLPKIVFKSSKGAEA